MKVKHHPILVLQNLKMVERDKCSVLNMNVNCKQMIKLYNVKKFQLI